MSNNLPHYDEGHLQFLEVLQREAEVFASAYEAYAEAGKQLRAAHDFYCENPEVRSREFSYQAALLNLEVTKALIAELKDSLYELQISGGFPNDRPTGSAEVLEEVLEMMQ